MLSAEDNSADRKVNVLTQTSSQTAVLSPPVDLGRMREVMRGEVAEIVDMYLNETARSLKTLAPAIERGNAREVEMIAHSCAGASMTCGMDALVPPFRELEGVAREGCLDKALELLDEAKTQFERVSAFLEIQLKPQPVA